MDDLLHDDRISWVVDIYTDLRERFREGAEYKPHEENNALAIEFLGAERLDTGFRDVVECCDLFLGYIHTLFSIRNNSDYGDWDQSVENLKSFLGTTPPEEEDWLRDSKEMIKTWISSLEGEKEEIPY